jgi:hypothetical protein
MSSLIVDRLPIIHVPEVISPLIPSLETDLIIDDNDVFIDQLRDRFNESPVIHSTGMRQFYSSEERAYLILLYVAKTSISISIVYSSTLWRHHGALAWSDSFDIANFSYQIFATYRYKFNSPLYRRGIVALAKYQFYNQSCFSGG